MKPLYYFCHSLTRNVARVLLDYKVVHPERLIENGPALICANHVSFLDPPLVSVAFKNEMHFLARSSLYSNAFARWLFPRLNVVPVDQDRAGMGGLKTLVRLLREGKRVLVFPEGSRSPDGKLQPAQAGAGLVVARTGGAAPVLPVRVFGAHESLPPGAAVPKLFRVTVVIGEPLRFSPEECAAATRETYQKFSDRILEAIAAIECPPDRLPVKL